MASRGERRARGSAARPGQLRPSRVVPKATPVGGSPVVAATLDLQRKAGNAAVVSLLRRAEGPGGTSIGEVVQRANSFYADQPRFTSKENPLATIAREVEADTSVKANAIVAHWRKSDDLKVAKTARTNLTAGPMQTVARPDEAAAWLDTPNPKPGTRKDPSWITTYGNLGTVEDQIMGDTPQSYNGGHLIAWEFLNEKANILGNIAPQAMLQNQALYRRIERTLEGRAEAKAGGIEAIVKTPYRKDPYSVTYKDLFDRGVISHATVRKEIANKQLEQKSISLAQMAPDTYDLYVLTQTGVADLATPDAREAREGVKTFKVLDYQDQAVNKLVWGSSPPALSILATNVNETTLEQEAFAFAHQVYLNYRSRPSQPQPQPQQQPAQQPLGPSPEELAARRKHALEVIQENQQLAIVILRLLQDEFDLSPTAAEGALINLLIESEPLTEGMDTEALL